jgi:DNA (cytosine-5)-methyltransferase 1
MPAARKKSHPAPFPFGSVFVLLRGSRTLRVGTRSDAVERCTIFAGVKFLFDLLPFQDLCAREHFSFSSHFMLARLMSPKLQELRMARHGESGRIVVDIEPELKRRVYSALSLSGRTLKEWFTRAAEELCDSKSTAVSRREVRYTRTPASAPMTFKEESAPRGTNAHGINSNGKTTAKYSVVSLFSGCGGMDLGFTGGFEVFGRRYRSLPFEIIWANDLNAEACKTYERNVGREIHRGDIWGFMGSLPEKADVIVGGFPCQDISVNGKRAGINGARSGLYRAMVEAIRRVKPKVFVAENVKALLRHQGWCEQVLADFRGLGYDVRCDLYRAADYGVPQTRERIFFVGTNKDTTPFTPPPPERNAATWMTAREAIGDLEGLDEAPHINHIWSKANVSPEQGNRRLLPDRPGYTIRAECHGNIQFHYRQPRRVSMREAARIQSFPDKFIFVSGLREIERQVGNAVPPVLAWHVANAVLKCLA